MSDATGDNRATVELAEIERLRADRDCEKRLRKDSDDHATDLRIALVELRERITGHPAYAELTEAEETDIGGDTAELSYLARVADVALGTSKQHAQKCKLDGGADMRNAWTYGDEAQYTPAMAAALDCIVRRLQMDVDEGSRPDQWAMEDLIRTAKAALPAGWVIGDA